MVRPGRRSDEDARLRIGRCEQFEAEAERPATARCLETADAIVAGMLAEQDRAEKLRVPFVPRAAEIGFALLRLVEAPLGFLDDFKDRRVSRAVPEDADADVDLVRPGIGVDQGDERDERIGLMWRKVGKPPCLLVGAGQHGRRLAKLRVVIHSDAVAQRYRLAGEDVAGGDFLVGQAVAGGHLDLSLGHFCAARRAHAGLAGERRREARSPCAVEDVARRERDAAGTAIERNGERRAFRLRLQLRHLTRDGFRRSIGGEALDMDPLLRDRDRAGRLRPRPSSGQGHK